MIAENSKLVISIAILLLTARRRDIFGNRSGGTLCWNHQPTSNNELDLDLIWMRIVSTNLNQPLTAKYEPEGLTINSVSLPSASSSILA